MPAIHQLARAAQLAQNLPVRLLKRQNGDDDDDDGGDAMDDIISGGSIAAIVVVVLAVFALAACWCLCCRGRKRKGRNSDGKQDGQSQEDKYKEKAIKKILKKIKKKVKKMLKKDKKDKKDNKDEEHADAPPAYGQGTHPGYMERERALGYNAGYNRLEEQDERVELSTTKYSS